MFRLLYLTFFGTRRTAVHAHAPAAAHDASHGAHGHDAAHAAHGGHLHDAPAAMATALIVLAIGSVLAGYVGVPNVLVSGGNRIEAFLEPSFAPPVGIETTRAEPAEPPVAEHGTGVELGLMGISTLAALGGIGLATMFFMGSTSRADEMAARFSGLHRLLLNKYYVDEIYNAVIVQPIKRVSTTLLWRGVDAGVIDGTVNGLGLAVRGWSAVLRRLQTGSVRAYAMSLFVGTVMILGYYLWR
jgi:NADH-quinone oxidoreductase subunit L